MPRTITKQLRSLMLTDAQLATPDPIYAGNMCDWEIMCGDMLESRGIKLELARSDRSNTTCEAYMAARRDVYEAFKMVYGGGTSPEIRPYTEAERRKFIREKVVTAICDLTDKEIWKAIYDLRLDETTDDGLKSVLEKGLTIGGGLRELLFERVTDAIALTLGMQLIPFAKASE